MPLQQIPWKKGVTQEGVEQNDHSDTLKMDEEKCILEHYFMDIQNVCTDFFEDNDVLIRVSEKKRIDIQTSAFEMFTALYVFLLNPNTKCCYSLQQWIEQLTCQDPAEIDTTDLTTIVSEIRSSHSQMGHLGVILKWAKEMKEQERY